MQWEWAVVGMQVRGMMGNYWAAAVLEAEASPTVGSIQRHGGWRWRHGGQRASSGTWRHWSLCSIHDTTQAQFLFYHCRQSLPSLHMNLETNCQKVACTPVLLSYDCYTQFWAVAWGLGAHGKYWQKFNWSEWPLFPAVHKLIRRLAIDLLDVVSLIVSFRCKSFLYFYYSFVQLSGSILINLPFTCGK